MRQWQLVLTNLIADHREDNPYRKALVRELVAYNDQHAPLENWQYVGFYVLGGRPRRSRPRRTRSYASRETMKGGSGSNLAAPSRLRERPETALARRWSVLRRRTAVHPLRTLNVDHDGRSAGSAPSFSDLAHREGYSFALAERGIYIVEFADAAASPFDGSTMRGLSGALCPRR
jgi:hypothetical protein